MTAIPNETPRATLARRIGLPLLTFYGLGTILGAGIYVLVGQVAGAAGMAAPLSFLLAGLVALVTALSYCQLVVAFPHSSGAALFVHEGLKRAWLSAFTGHLVILTGIVSAATLANGFVGYLQVLVDLPDALVISLVVGAMTALALWGIAESLWVAALITLIEIGGLLIVILLTGESLAVIPDRWSDLLVLSSWSHGLGVAAGALLAFYAFLGFEDMVNIVEEVRVPERTMPVAIMLAMGCATLLYLLVAVVAVLTLSPAQLGASGAPLRDLLVEQHPQAAQALVWISLFAVINGILIQIIMASRMLYGMALRQHAPRAFALVSSRTRTPWLATLVAALLVWVFALALPLVTLAKLTSLVVLFIFVLVNLSLWRLVRAGRMKSVPWLPSAPGLGVLLCVTLLVFQLVALLS